MKPKGKIFSDAILSSLLGHLKKKKKKEFKEEFM